MLDRNRLYGSRSEGQKGMGYTQAAAIVASLGPKYEYGDLSLEEIALLENAYRYIEAHESQLELYATGGDNYLGSKDHYDDNPLGIFRVIIGGSVGALALIGVYGIYDYPQEILELMRGVNIEPIIVQGREVLSALMNR